MPQSTKEKKVVTKMVAKLNKYVYVFKTSLMDAMVYVVDFFGRSGFFAFIIGIYLLLWKAIYSNGNGVISGFTINMMIWYLVLTEVVTLSTTNYYQEVSDDIKTGNIAYLLNKPYHYVTYSFYNNMGKIMVRMLVNIVVGFIVGMVFVGPLKGFNLYMIPFVFICLLLGMFINYFINFALALSAFWVEENLPFRWIYQKLIFTLGGMLLPLDLFPNWLQGISKKLPFAYVTYGPAKLFVDFSYNHFTTLILGQLIYLAIVVAICYGVYKKGVSKLNVNGG